MQAKSILQLREEVTFDAADFASIVREVTFSSFPTDVQIRLIDFIAKSGTNNVGGRVKLQRYEHLHSYMRPSM